MILTDFASLHPTFAFMRIAVNAIFLQKNQLEGYGYNVKETFSRIVRQHPEHEFIFVFDRRYDPDFIFGPNVKAIVVGPPARHPLAFKYWYDVKAPLALRRYKPDLWIQPYGFCSLSTRIPQLLMVHDLAFKHYPGFVSTANRWYYRWYTGRFLRKAKAVITVSEFSKQDILKHYPLAEEKITVVHSAAKDIFVPLSWHEKEKVKQGYADGREYFLFTGGVHPRKNLMNLLKAFSLFKKWQHSNMKLLVAGRLAWQYKELTEKLKTYKYRDDVVMLGYLPEEQLVRVTAAAYALVFPSFFEGFGVPVLEAMQAEVPVIASNAGSIPEVGGEAALYADPADPDAFAKQMLSLYKDETVRKNLIEKGKQQAAIFDWDKAANRFWQQILAAAAK